MPGRVKNGASFAHRRPAKGLAGHGLAGVSFDLIPSTVLAKPRKIMYALSNDKLQELLEEG